MDLLIKTSENFEILWIALSEKFNFSTKIQISENSATLTQIMTIYEKSCYQQSLIAFQNEFLT